MQDLVRATLAELQSTSKLSKRDGGPVTGWELNGLAIGDESVKHPKVRELLSRLYYRQGSKGWLLSRSLCFLVSGSTIPTVLGENPYEDMYTMFKKSNGIDAPFVGNMATRHGSREEDNVVQRLSEKLGGKRIFELGSVMINDKSLCGLVVGIDDPPNPMEMRQLNALAYIIDKVSASPDGLTEDGELVEIKCPVWRMPDPTCVPKHYRAQLNMEMEMCDAESVIFVEYVPAGGVRHGFEDAEERAKKDKIKETMCVTRVRRQRGWLLRRAERVAWYIEQVLLHREVDPGWYDRMKAWEAYERWCMRQVDVIMDAMKDDESMHPLFRYLCGPKSMRMTHEEKLLLLMDRCNMATVTRPCKPPCIQAMLDERDELGITPAIVPFDYMPHTLLLQSRCLALGKASVPINRTALCRGEPIIVEDNHHAKIARAIHYGAVQFTNM